MTASVEEVVADRIHEVRALAEKLLADLKIYGDETDPPDWAQAGTLGAVLEDLREAGRGVAALAGPGR